MGLDVAGVVYAEVSVRFSRIEDVEEALPPERLTAAYPRRHSVPHLLPCGSAQIP